MGEMCKCELPQKLPQKTQSLSYLIQVNQNYLNYLFESLHTIDWITLYWMYFNMSLLT